MNADRLVHFSAGDCSVCASSGAAFLLVRREAGTPIFFCPLCECSWETPPQPYVVDEIVSIEQRAPDGVRLPTESEAKTLQKRFPSLAELETAEWERFLSDLLQ